MLGRYCFIQQQKQGWVVSQIPYYPQEAWKISCLYFALICTQLDCSPSDCFAAGAISIWCLVYLSTKNLHPTLSSTDTCFVLCVPWNFQIDAKAMAGTCRMLTSRFLLSLAAGGWSCVWKWNGNHIGDWYACTMDMSWQEEIALHRLLGNTFK